VGESITQLVHLSMLDLAGIGTAVTQREALRDRIKQHVASAWATRAGGGRHRAGAELQPPPAVQRLCRGARRRGRLHPARRLGMLPRCWPTARRHRSITDIALDLGFNNMAHFSRVFAQRYGVPPSVYRRLGYGQTVMVR
jgi:AraC-like DNA-binding protein